EHLALFFGIFHRYALIFASQIVLTSFAQAVARRWCRVTLAILHLPSWPYGLSPVNPVKRRAATDM
ncbi:hypothetical protein, partial [Serratia marcescens]